MSSADVKVDDETSESGSVSPRITIEELKMQIEEKQNLLAKKIAEKADKEGDAETIGRAQPGPDWIASPGEPVTQIDVKQKIANLEKLTKENEKIQEMQRTQQAKIEEARRELDTMKEVDMSTPTAADAKDPNAEEFASAVKLEAGEEVDEDVGGKHESTASSGNQRWLTRFLLDALFRLFSFVSLRELKDQVYRALEERLWKFLFFLVHFCKFVIENRNREPTVNPRFLNRFHEQRPVADHRSPVVKPVFVELAKDRLKVEDPFQSNVAGPAQAYRVNVFGVFQRRHPLDVAEFIQR